MAIDLKSYIRININNSERSMGMISSGAYNYINVLEKASDASWTRNSVISNNIANVDTPGYKRKDVQFEQYLQSAVSGGCSLDDNVAEADLESLTGTIQIMQQQVIV